MLATALAAGSLVAAPARAQDAAANGTLTPKGAAQQNAATAAGPTGAAAPTTDTVSGGDGSRLEEIVVTARKREETLNSVPLSVSAFSAGQIAARGIVDLTDVSNFTPGFHFQNQVGGGAGRNDRTINTLTFRGLLLANDQGVTAGGLLFVDGAPVIGGQAPPTADIERIEVLKGPQSAFFGRSTFSGAVNYVTKDPPRTISGDAAISGGSYGSNSEEVSVGGPLLGDSLRGRFTVYHNEKGGEYTNAALPSQTLGEQETTSFSANVLWTPTSRLRVRGAATYFTDEDGPPAQIALKQADFNCNLGGTLGRYYCGDLPSVGDLPRGIVSGNYALDPYARMYTLDNARHFPTIFNPDFANSDGGLHRKAIQASIRMDYTLPGDFVLTSVSAYQRDQTGSLLDLAFRDGQNLRNPYFPAVNPNLSYYRYLAIYETLQSNFNQELRITSPQDRSFRWMLGGNVLTAQQESSDIFGIGVTGPSFFSTYVKYAPVTTAVFGALYYDFTPALTLSGELRDQRDDVRQDVLGSSAGVYLNPTRKYSQAFLSLSPRITLNYKFADHSLVYALWSRGYRPGGFNLTLSPQANSPAVIAAAEAAAPGAGIAYQQERLDNYEVGFKSLFFDGRVQVNVDAYYDNYTDGQVTQQITFFTNTTQTNGTVVPTVNAASITRNTGRIRLDGVEGDATWQVSRQFQVSVTGAFNDSKVKSGYCSDCVGIDGTNSLAGKRLLGVPKYTATASGEYSDHLFGDYNWFARADYVFRGKEFVDQDDVASIAAKHLINLRLGLRNDRYSLEVFCQNCANDLTAESATYGSADVFTIGQPGGVKQEIRYGLPDRRTLGVRLGARF